MIKAMILKMKQSATTLVTEKSEKDDSTELKCLHSLERPLFAKSTLRFPIKINVFISLWQKKKKNRKANYITTIQSGT